MRFDTRVSSLLAWFLGATVSVAVVAMLQQFFASTRTEYSYGDGALLELYTIHASHGEWQLGPYSRFGWHHPGPLLFYALNPVYRLFGSHTFALNAGAFAINLASLLVIGWVITRWARPSVGYAILAMLALFLFRVGDITISYWNPHVVVVAFAAFVLVCAALWVGRTAALPIALLFASFLAQTHVSLAPIVAVLISTSVARLAIAHRLSGSATRSRSLRWSIAASACALVIVWWAPVAEELSNDPGNLSKVLQFFAEPYAGQPWAAAAQVWGENISAVLRSGFSIPSGITGQFTGGFVWVAVAATQLLALVLVGKHSSQHGDCFHAALCHVGWVSSLLALWSITRVREFVADYMVFWVSILGALNWAALMGAAVSWLVPALSDARRPQRLHVTTLAIAGLAAFVLIEVAQFRHNTLVPPEEPARRVGVLANAVVSYLQDQRIQRPLVRASPEVWSEATGVIVQLYKRGVPVVVPSNLVSRFGQPLAPIAIADAVVDIASPLTHAQLSRRSFDRLIAAAGDIYVHVTVAPDVLSAAPPRF